MHRDWLVNCSPPAACVEGKQLVVVVVFGAVSVGKRVIKQNVLVHCI